MKVNQSTGASQQNVNQNTSALNPPHGQAGHRCDIPVGTPLNSASNKVVPAATNSDSNPQVPALLKLDSTVTLPKYWHKLQF